MPGHLLLCTDLDRTLIPNGPQPESEGAREHFATLAGRDEVTLAYVSGRDLALVEAAIEQYHLPPPDFILGDVGTTIYHPGADGSWQRQHAWDEEIAADWKGLDHARLAQALRHLPGLELQEADRQNIFKLSYYAPLHTDRETLSAQIDELADSLHVRLRAVWSLDEEAGVLLLDVLPRRASKFHSIEALMRQQGFELGETVFCGDSGNDVEVLASPVPAVLVANSPPEVQALARHLAENAGYADRLFVARGDFMGMNGNYSAGILEGIAHYHADTVGWMGFAAGAESS